MYIFSICLWSISLHMYMQCLHLSLSLNMYTQYPHLLSTSLNMYTLYFCPPSVRCNRWICNTFVLPLSLNVYRFYCILYLHMSLNMSTFCEQQIKHNWKPISPLSFKRRHKLQVQNISCWYSGIKCTLTATFCMRLSQQDMCLSVPPFIIKWMKKLKWSINCNQLHCAVSFLSS
jgi:hypothetical protein